MGLFLAKYWWAIGVAVCLTVIGICLELIEQQNAEARDEYCRFANCEQFAHGPVRLQADQMLRMPRP
jgi:hypothetical protein